MAEAFHGETFVRLEWDSLLTCWLGGIDGPPGLHTEVAIWLPDGDLATGRRQAWESLDELRRHEERARLTVAAEMVVVYNDAWRGEEGPVTAAVIPRTGQRGLVRNAALKALGKVGGASRTEQWHARPAASPDLTPKPGGGCRARCPAGRVSS